MNAISDILIHPGDGEFDRYLTGWNTRIVHRPDYIVAARTPEQIEDAVRFAAERRLPIHVQSTGHGALAVCTGGLLIDCSGIAGIEIDSSRKSALVGPGTRWQDLLNAAQKHGLAGLAGSAGRVGVVGYALGGGAGWLARGYGLCSDKIEEVEIVTADGARRWVSAEAEPELLWALRGGGANFGVVTSMRLQLVPTPTIYAGAIYWPMDKSLEVLTAYRELLQDVPNDFGSSVAFLLFPAEAPVPEPLRDTPVVGVRLCCPGDREPPNSLLAPMRNIDGAVLDTMRAMPFCEIGSLTMDSPLDLPRIGYSESLSALTDETIEGLAEVLTPGAPFAGLELRHTAGGKARPPESHAGLAYWDSSFLLFCISVTPDPATEAKAEAFGKRLDALLRPVRTNTNPFTFLLTQRTPVGDGEAARVRQAFHPTHYARLAELKKRYDPDNLFGGDRNIPPAK